MTLQIIDFSTSQPSQSNGGLARTIPQAPSLITVANFGLYIGNSTNIVELAATIGFTSTAGTPEILFRVFRDTQVIYTARNDTVAVNENLTPSFQVLDINAPLGYHSYSLTAEVLNAAPLNQAEVVGPVTFTGLSLA